jgi:ligand-binding sensor domain-containing protein
VDGSDNIWIGTAFGGLAKFDGNSTWEVYDADSTDLPYNRIYCIKVAANGDIWVGASGSDEDGALSILSVAGTWQSYTTADSDLPDNRVLSLEIDGNGNSWVGTGRGLAKLTGTTWTVINTSISGLPHNDILALVIDEGGNRWIGTNGGGLAKFTNTDWTVYDSANSDLGVENVTSIAVGKDNAKWIGTGNFAYGNLTKLKEQTWTKYDPTNSVLPSNHITALYMDSKGGLWIGTQSGLVLLKDSLWTSYKQDLVSGTTNKTGNSGKIVVDDSASFISRKVRKGDDFYNETDTVFSVIDSVVSETQLLLKDQNVTGNDIKYFITRDKTAPDYSGLPMEGEVSCIIEDQAGVMWFGAAEYYWDNSGGLVSFDGVSTWKIYNTGNADLPENFVTDVAVDLAGNIWAATRGGGLAKFNGTTTWQVFNQANSGLPSDKVHAVTTDSSGRLWIGTHAGLAVFNGTDNWKVLDISNSGLPHNVVTSIAIDADGNKWIATGGGGGPNPGPNAGGLTVCNTCDPIAGIHDRPQKFDGDIAEQVPRLQCTPNPFIRSTSIGYTVPRTSQVNLSLFTMQGKLVTTLVDKEMCQGSYLTLWDETDVQNGMYLCRLQIGRSTVLTTNLVKAE